MVGDMCIMVVAVINYWLAVMDDGGTGVMYGWADVGYWFCDMGYG
jgi:hypothetical protein